MAGLIFIFLYFCIFLGWVVAFFIAAWLIITQRKARSSGRKNRAAELCVYRGKLFYRP